MSTAYEQDQVIPITLCYGSQRFTGRGTVRNSLPMSGGQTRYGVRCMDDADPEDDLARGVTEVFNDLQRRGLQEPTGTG